MNKPKDIDAVITWVDGSDPSHQDKLASYLTNYTTKPESANPERFSDNGEIFYSVMSILKFAPWVRYIYIVTDGQTPPFYGQLNDPELLEKIRIIDHKEIFQDYEHVLPTFNSLSIEAMLWRIKGLSEDFIYLNDDMMFIRPVTPNNFVDDSSYIVRGKWRKKRNQKWLHRLKLALRKPEKTLHVSHRDTQESSSDAISPSPRYLDLPHCPCIMNSSFFRKFFASHPKILERTINHRFRHPDQIWAISLFVHQTLLQQTSTIEYRQQTAYIKADRYSEFRVTKIFEHADENQNYLFSCIQSLDSATPSTLTLITNWLKLHILS